MHLFNFTHRGTGSWIGLHRETLVKCEITAAVAMWDSESVVWDNNPYGGLLVCSRPSGGTAAAVPASRTSWSQGVGCSLCAGLHSYVYRITWIWEETVWNHSKQISPFMKSLYNLSELLITQQRKNSRHLWWKLPLSHIILITVSTSCLGWPLDSVLIPGWRGRQSTHRPRGCCAPVNCGTVLISAPGASQWVELFLSEA